MHDFPSDIAFTPAVKTIQQQKGSRKSYARMEQSGGWQTTVTSDLTEFLADLDMFYLGTANAKGQPYIQYRGGPPGFLKVIDDRTLAFADFGGTVALRRDTAAIVVFVGEPPDPDPDAVPIGRVVKGEAVLKKLLAAAAVPADPKQPVDVRRVIRTE